MPEVGIPKRIFRSVNILNFIEVLVYTVLIAFIVNACQSQNNLRQVYLRFVVVFGRSVFKRRIDFYNIVIASH